MAVGHIPPTQLRSYDSAAIGVVFVKFLLYKRSLLRMDLESGIKWHLQVLPRGMTLIKIIHDPLQNNRLERNSAFSRRCFPGSALPFSHSLLWRQIKNSLRSH